MHMGSPNTCISATISPEGDNFSYKLVQGDQFFGGAGGGGGWKQNFRDIAHIMSQTNSP